MFSFAKKLVDKLEGVNGPESDTYYKNTLSRNNGYGLRVMHVEPESLASKLGFESWFDYIVGFADHDLPIPSLGHNAHSYLISDDGSFNFGTIPIAEQARMVDFDMVSQELTTIATSPNPNVKFEVWNAKGGVLRVISVPLLSDISESSTQTSQGTLNLHRNFQSVGLTIQSQHISSASVVYKVLTSQPNSPAFRAALVPHSDYIIGCDSAFPTDDNKEGLLTSGGESALLKTILSYYKKHLEILQDEKIPIILLVYNHDYDIVRKVTVHLSRSWSFDKNKGLLGCDVGYGLLHRLPLVVGKFDSSMKVLGDELYHNDEDYSYKLSKKEITSLEVHASSHGFDSAPNTVANEQITNVGPPPGAPVTPSSQSGTSPIKDVIMDEISLEMDDEFLASPTGDSAQAREGVFSASSPGQLLPSFLIPEKADSTATESVEYPVAASLKPPVFEPSVQTFSNIEASESSIPALAPPVIQPPTKSFQSSVSPPPVRSLDSQVPSAVASSEPPPPPNNSLASQQGPPPPAHSMSSMPPRSPKIAGRRKRHVHAPFTNLDALTDIMNEELSKSKENDVRLFPETTDPNLPPPPKF